MKETIICEEEEDNHRIVALCVFSSKPQLIGNAAFVWSCTHTSGGQLTCDPKDYFVTQMLLEQIICDPKAPKKLICDPEAARAGILL